MLKTGHERHVKSSMSECPQKQSTPLIRAHHLCPKISTSGNNLQREHSILIKIEPQKEEAGALGIDA